MLIRRWLVFGAPFVAVAALAAPSAEAGLVGGLLAGSPSHAGAAAAGRPWTLGGVPCHTVAMPVATPVGVLEPCPGVRPGSSVLVPQAGETFLCTLNFMWRGTDGATYMGSAGHCALPAPGEQVFAKGTGPPVLDGAGRRIGEFAYAVLEDPRDFSLIRLDPGVAASPQMCHFGGPTGVDAERPGLSTPTVLQVFGQGVGVSAVAPARPLVALGMPDPDHVFASGVIVPGDSGAGVTAADGRAVGVVVTVGAHLAGIGVDGVDAGLVGITRIEPQVAGATRATGTGYTLVTAATL